MFLKNKKGIGFIACYLVIVVLLTLGSAILLQSVSEKRVAEKERASMQAFWLAEAGIDKAIWYVSPGITAPDGSKDGSWYTTAYPAPPGIGSTDPREENLGIGLTYTFWLQDAGNLPDWPHRKKITIYPTGLTNQSNFPVLINTRDSAWKDTTNGGRVAQSDGGDILFTSSGGTLSDKLDHEIEDYDETTGKLIAWVKVPTVSASDNTEIYIYYGNSDLGEDENQWNPTGVWDSNYKGVWHLKEDPSGTSPQMEDSTSNNYDGTSVGSMASDDQVTGQVNGSLDFDEDYIIEVGDIGSGIKTVELWIDTDSRDTGVLELIDNSTYIEVKHDEVETPGFTASTIYVNGSSSSQDLDSGWHHVVVTTDTGIAANGVRMAEANSSYLSGKLDEVRISDVARSADWIAASFNNQNDPSSFYSVKREATIYAQGKVEGLSRTIQTQIEIKKTWLSKIPSAVYTRNKIEVSFDERDDPYITGGDAGTGIAGIYSTDKITLKEGAAGCIEGDPAISEDQEPPEDLEYGIWDAFDINALKAQAIADETYFTADEYNKMGKYTLPVVADEPNGVFFFDTEGGVPLDDEVIEQNKEANVELKGTNYVDPDTGEQSAVSGVIVVVGDLKIVDTPVYDFLFDGVVLVLDDLNLEDKRTGRRDGTNDSDIFIRGAVLNDNIIQETGKKEKKKPTKKSIIKIENATIEYEPDIITDTQPPSVIFESWQEIY